MRFLSLFSGGGLGDYGLELAGMECVGQVEIDDYCQKILALRWPHVPKWRDIKNVKANEVFKKCGPLDLISGGFPCQDISIAGKAAGIEGARSSLWGEQFRIISEIRPRYCLVENVSEILNRGIGRVLGDLSSVGYDSEWITLPSWFFGSPHNRERVWIVGYPQDHGRKHTIDASSSGLFEGRLFKEISIKGGITSHKERFHQQVRASEFVRKSNGTPNRMDRIRMCGNGQQVQDVKWIAERILSHDV